MDNSSESSTLSGRSAGHPTLRVVIPPQPSEEIIFHDLCAKNIVLINSRRTAFRNKPTEEACYGVVFTHRPLLDNEIFEVTIDEIIDYWKSYSFGIGVTLQMPTNDSTCQWLHDLPNNAWYMYGNDVYEWGENLIEGYGRDLQGLQEGDRVGVMRKENGDLHFFLNDEDMGPSAKGIPSDTFGIIDIGGCVVRASVPDSSTPLSR